MDFRTFVHGPSADLLHRILEHDIATDKLRKVDDAVPVRVNGGHQLFRDIAHAAGNEERLHLLFRQSPITIDIDALEQQPLPAGGVRREQTSVRLVGNPAHVLTPSRLWDHRSKWNGVQQSDTFD